MTNDFMVKSYGRDLRVSIRPGDGIPLLLMNGIGARLEVLEPFVDALSSNRTVIRFDIPGVGGSPDPWIPYTLSSMAITIDRMLDHLGYGQVDVLGLSWGGNLAQQFALQHRARCHKLVLVATGPGTFSVPGSPRVIMRMLNRRRYEDPEYARKVAGNLYGGTMRCQTYNASDFLHSREGSSNIGYYYQLLASYGWSSIPFLPFIKQKTMVLAGNDDPLIPLINAKMMGCLIPNADVCVYDGGHLAVLTEADELAPIIENFLD